MAQSEKPTRQPAPKSVASGPKRPYGPARKNVPPKTSYRKRGRPAKSVIGPAEITFISNKLAEGWTIAELAEHLCVEYTTIQHHIKRNIQPALRQPLLRGPEFSLARLERLYAIAMKKFFDETPAETREQVIEVFASSLPLAKEGRHKPSKKDDGSKRIKPSRTKVGKVLKRMTFTISRSPIAYLQLAMQLDDRIRALKGHNAPIKLQIVGGDTEDDEFRVAGATPAEHDAMALDRIRRLITDQRAYETSLREQGFSIEAEARIVEGEFVAPIESQS